VHFLGGTLGQLLVPALLLVHFVRRGRQPVGAACCLWWVGQSLANVAIYMADARDLALPLVGGGDHDWNELFHRFGALDADAVARISGVTRAAGVLVMLGGLAWTGRSALSTDRAEATNEDGSSRASSHQADRQGGRRRARECSATAPQVCARMSALRAMRIAP
jgi:hypothetical protein